MKSKIGLELRDEKTAETSDARLEDFEKLNAAYQPPSELAPDLIRVSTTASVSDAVKAILLLLGRKAINCGQQHGLR